MINSSVGARHRTAAYDTRCVLAVGMLTTAWRVRLTARAKPIRRQSKVVTIMLLLLSPRLPKRQQSNPRGCRTRRRGNTSFTRTGTQSYTIINYIPFAYSRHSLPTHRNLLLQNRGCLRHMPQPASTVNNGACVCSWVSSHILPLHRADNKFPQPRHVDNTIKLESANQLSPLLPKLVNDSIGTQLFPTPHPRLPPPPHGTSCDTVHVSKCAMFSPSKSKNCRFTREIQMPSKHTKTKRFPRRLTPRSAFASSLTLGEAGRV